MADTQKIRAIAARLSREKNGDDLIVVVSAMGKTTDQMVALAKQISRHPNRRELDMLLTAGERISMSLLSLALQEEGLQAISFTGSQSGILTDSEHGNATIINVTGFRLREELNHGKVVIVDGFQGVSPQKEVTTLGRGGSDTTAVALAKYMDADMCEIYSDVDGVYTADPHKIPGARKFPVIDYRLMLALAYGGSRVMHSRSVELAARHGMAIKVKSTFDTGEGTVIKRTDISEQYGVEALTHKNDLHKLVVYGIEAAKLWQIVGDCGVDVFYYTLQDDDWSLYCTGNDLALLQNELSTRQMNYDWQEGYSSMSLCGLKLPKKADFVAEAITYCSANGYKPVTVVDKDFSLMLLFNVADCLPLAKLAHQKYIEVSDGR